MQFRAPLVVIKAFDSDSGFMQVISVDFPHSPARILVGFDSVDGLPLFLAVRIAEKRIMVLWFWVIASPVLLFMFCSSFFVFA